MMVLSEILKNTGFEISGNPEKIRIKHITDDSRQVIPGSFFIARPGTSSNGGKYIVEAVKKGAAAVGIEKKHAAKIPVPAVLFKDIKRAVPVLADNFYGAPDAGLYIAGVTGTNGKTTVTYLVEKIWKEAGRKAGVLGTINYRYGGRTFPSVNTTPSIFSLKRIFSEMKKKGVKNTVLEASSHGLDQGRLDGVRFDCAAFTNLTRDHLDYHNTLGRYFTAKKKLFELLSESSKRRKCSIINTDDKYGRLLYRGIKGDSFSFGLSGREDFSAGIRSMSAAFSVFTLKYPGGSFEVRFPLLGKHNVYNALCAAGIAFSSGVKPAHISQGLMSGAMVPGRLESIGLQSGATAVVDYAHTDDALFNVLSSLRGIIKKGRLITVFGCGGDRDRKKRPMMGHVAGRLSDYLIITSDNPRSEEPEKIIKEIVPGVRESGNRNYEIEKDRYLAIKKGIEYSRSGDILLIAGKGHETYQIFRDKTVHFDDVETIREIEKKKNGKN